MIISFPRKFFIKWGFIVLALCAGFIVFIFGYQGFMNILGSDNTELHFLDRMWFVAFASASLMISFICFFSRAQVVFSADALQRHYLLFGYQTLKKRSFYEQIEHAKVLDNDIVEILLRYGHSWNIEGFPTRAHAESFVETLNSHLQEGLGAPTGRARKEAVKAQSRLEQFKKKRKKRWGRSRAVSGGRKNEKRKMDLP